MEEIKTKVCSKCRIEKDVSEFHKNSTNNDGYNYQCKLCRKNHYNETHDVVKKYKIDNKDKINSYMSIYRKQNKDRISITVRKYYEENKDVILPQKRQYKLENRDKIQIKVDEYQELHREEIRERARIYNYFVAKYSTYVDKLTIEENPIEGENGELLCLCNYCKEYFPVTNGAVKNRICSLDGKKGGESRLYCSDSCKNDCDIYYAQSIPKSLRNATKQSRCNQNRVRQILLDIQLDEEGYNWCEKCGDIFSPEDLFFHHNIPVGDNHNEYDNAAHYMLVCKDHHEHKGCLGNPYE